MRTQKVAISECQSTFSYHTFNHSRLMIGSFVFFYLRSKTPDIDATLNKVRGKNAPNVTQINVQYTIIHRCIRSILLYCTIITIVNYSRMSLTYAMHFISLFLCVFHLFCVCLTLWFHLFGTYVDVIFFVLLTYSEHIGAIIGSNNANPLVIQIDRYFQLSIHQMRFFCCCTKKLFIFLST